MKAVLPPAEATRTQNRTTRFCLAVILFLYSTAVLNVVRAATAFMPLHAAAAAAHRCCCPPCALRLDLHAAVPPCCACLQSLRRAWSCLNLCTLFMAVASLAAQIVPRMGYSADGVGNFAVLTLLTALGTGLYLQCIYADPGGAGGVRAGRAVSATNACPAWPAQIRWPRIFLWPLGFGAL